MTTKHEHLNAANITALERQLVAAGFNHYDKDGVRYWGHPKLGQGRYFIDALIWAIGGGPYDTRALITDALSETK